MPGRLIYEFDPLTLVPTLTEERVDGEQPNLLARSAEIKWKLSEQGAAIPVSIRSKRGGPIPGMTGFGTGALLVEETKFHWLSFNKPLESSLVDGSLVGSKDDIQRLVDLKQVARQAEPEDQEQ